MLNTIILSGTKGSSRRVKGETRRAVAQLVEHLSAMQENPGLIYGKYGNLDSVRDVEEAVVDQSSRLA